MLGPSFGLRFGKGLLNPEKAKSPHRDETVDRKGEVVKYKKDGGNSPFDSAMPTMNELQRNPLYYQRVKNFVCFTEVRRLKRRDLMEKIAARYRSGIEKHCKQGGLIYAVERGRYMDAWEDFTARLRMGSGPDDIVLEIWGNHGYNEIVQGLESSADIPETIIASNKRFEMDDVMRWSPVLSLTSNGQIHCVHRRSWETCCTVDGRGCCCIDPLDSRATFDSQGERLLAFVDADGEFVPTEEPTRRHKQIERMSNESEKLEDWGFSDTIELSDDESDSDMRALWVETPTALQRSWNEAPGDRVYDRFSPMPRSTRSQRMFL